jgi:hypothetical protein
LSFHGGFVILLSKSVTVIKGSSTVTVSIMALQFELAWKRAFRLPCILILSLCFFLPNAAAGATETETYEVVAEGRALLGEDTTPAQAQALALNNARRIAVERASGILVRGSSVVYNSQLISDLISAFSKGLIIHEELLDDGMKTEDGRAVYVSRIRARIKPVKQETQKDIRIIKTGISRVDRPFSSSNPVFQDKDEIRIMIRAEGDLNMNIFSVSQDGGVVRLLPNPYLKQDRIPSRQDFIFPDEALRNAGFKLRVYVPKNLSKAYETIIVIGTKEKADFLSGKGKESTLSDLMGELSLVEQSSWADAVIGYEVRR